MAGTMVLLSTTLGILLSPYWFALDFLVGVNLLVFALTGFCPVAVLLHSKGVEDDCGPRPAKVAEAE